MAGNVVLAEGAEQFLLIISLFSMTPYQSKKKPFFMHQTFASQIFNRMLNVFHFVVNDRVQSDLGVSETCSLTDTENSLLAIMNFCQADTLHLNKPHLTLAHPCLTTGSHSAAQ